MKFTEKGTSGTLLGTYINSVKLSNNPMKYLLLLSHFTDEETDTECLSNLSPRLDN